jgi:hypothetical protein
MSDEDRDVDIESDVSTKIKYCSFEMRGPIASGGYYFHAITISLQIDDDDQISIDGMDMGSGSGSGSGSTNIPDGTQFMTQVG